MTKRARFLMVTILILVFAPVGALAQEPATAVEPAVGPASSTSAAVTRDASETRSEFADLLRRQPTELGTILKLDPTLLSNRVYLATYPALAAFVAEHPEVAHNPGYYLASVSGPSEYSPGAHVFDKLTEAFSIIGVMLLFVFAAAWLIRTFVEQRRWSRLSSIQNEVHNKLLDRFGSNEELLTYIQSSAGKKFLESAPIPVSSRQVSGGAPVDRILWSAQLGIVVAAASVGVMFVSSRFGVEVAQALSAMGVIGLCVGVGFMLSGLASFLLSRRMGLWQDPMAEEAGRGLLD